MHLIKTLAGKVNSPVHELEKKIEAAARAAKGTGKAAQEPRSQREASQRRAASCWSELKTINGIPVIIHNLGAADGDFLQAWPTR